MPFDHKLLCIKIPMKKLLPFLFGLILLATGCAITEGYVGVGTSVYYDPFPRYYYYPHYYRHIVPGKITDRKTNDYGRHTSQQSKHLFSIINPL